jgi:hypothetical protein
VNLITLFRKNATGGLFNYQLLCEYRNETKAEETPEDWKWTKAEKDLDAFGSIYQTIQSFQFSRKKTLLYTTHSQRRYWMNPAAP